MKDLWQSFAAEIVVRIILSLKRLKEAKVVADLTEAGRLFHAFIVDGRNELA